MKKTMYDKIWDQHLVIQPKQGPSILYIDRPLIHEVTSPQAFDGLRMNHRQVRHPEKIFATLDHSIPTKDRDKPIEDETARTQVEKLIENCKEFNIKLFDLNHPDQGIIHVVPPELGFILPGMTVVCGDSHTATHGAFGAIAFGIGTSEVEHVLATQTIQQIKSKNMQINIIGQLAPYVTAKDIILGIINQITTAGGTGYAIEYTGDVIKHLSMESRMTICNMTIEAGARIGMIAPDQTTFSYLADKPYAPKGDLWNQALTHWKTLFSDEDAFFDKTITFNCDHLAPQVTWGTSPGQSTNIYDEVPNPEKFLTSEEQEACKNALKYMGLESGTRIQDIQIDQVFIGSCTNGRIEDLRQAAEILKGKKIHSHVKGLVVPGSGAVKRQAELEKLDQIFINAGLEWREPGCSTCLGMNDDLIPAGQRCAATSNRNFEGRQGKNSRTHLVSPVMAAAAAIAGHFIHPKEI